MRRWRVRLMPVRQPLFDAEAIGGNGEMDEIRVKKVDLLEKLKGNRAAHATMVREAQEGYKAKVIEVLEKRLDEAKNGQNVTHVIFLQTPSDHTADYDTRIRMLEMCVNDEIPLHVCELRQYVMDEWDWTGEALANNALYSQTARGRLHRRGDRNPFDD